jgi:hypothetical protein
MTRGGVVGFSDYLRLHGREQRCYKHRMSVIGELGRKGLPRAIPSQELLRALGSSAAFCSWDAANSGVSDLKARWPFLFSHPLSGAKKKPAH